jgi:hypothetical protein
MGLPTLEPGEKGERGVLYWVGGDWIRGWRQRVNENLNNREGRRVVVERSASTDKSLTPVDYRDGDVGVIEKPSPLKPRTPRETTELLAQITAQHMMKLRREHPEVYRSKLAELRAEHPEYRRHTDDQLTSIIVEFTRATMAEPSVRRITTPNGWKGPVIRS